ncbi:hypothetical protein LINPERHAP2_LOCUS19244 [Linum perenne]
MGFAASFRSDDVGFRGGIWLVWDPLIISIDILEFRVQFIHAKMSLEECSTCFLTAVYASPQATTRVLLWDALKRLSINQNAHWAVIGDFNAILLVEDKRGGSAFERRRSKSFIETVDLCGLSNIPFSGPRFTWGRNGLLSRIDRALVNASWIQMFPELAVTHLHKIKSDHRPILLCPSVQVYSTNTKPFRFLSAWLSHSSFNFFVKNKWGASLELSYALDDLSSQLKKWNKNVFGNIFKRKKRLLNLLVKAENVVAGNPSDFNRREEAVIKAKLEMVLWQEEELWVHKSRSKWVMDGDKNTR